jgi:hypothetical protein
MKSLVIGILLAALVVPCRAGIFGHACPSCGCSELKKVCRTVPEVKKITETKYVVECEDICVQGKTHSEDRLVSGPGCAEGAHYETVRVPTCDRIITRKKLKKVTTTVEKPGWKCVVDTVCSQCGCQCGTGECGK